MDQGPGLNKCGEMCASIRQSVCPDLTRREQALLTTTLPTVVAGAFPA